MRHPLKIWCLLIIVSVSLACSSGRGYDGGYGGGPFTETSRRTISPGGNPAIVRGRAVDVNVQFFNPDAQQLTLTLFDGVTITAVRDRVSRSQYGTMWTGATQKGGRVMIVRRGDVVVADIFDGRGKAYQIRPLGDRVHGIYENDGRQFLREADPEPVTAKNDFEADTCSSDSPASIDAMIVYTDDVRAALGSAEAAEAEAFLAVEAANQSYINSDITQRLRLVHVAEVSYAESGSSLTDRNRLQNPSDGFMDGVHTLRNSHAADIVALFTNTLDACGRAYIMSSVGNSMESNAFGVVERSCAATNFSYAHEMAHIMGARHDWFVDSTNNSPYAYNHGFVKKTPTAPATPWRTVMSYNDDCASIGGCDRVGYFSNPNVNYPVGNDPMGTTSGQQADNHLTLNNTALTVANFRCSSPGITNVWMKDTWSDTGLQPDPATAGQDMWKSPYIWVRNSQDTTLVKQHMNEDPITGATNWVYAKLHNGGSTSTSGNLEFWYANAGVSLTWPGSWTMLGSVPVSSFAAHATRIVEQSWPSTPGPGHFCMIARWVSASDPMTAEGSDINANTRNNNNIVWRNLNVVGDGDEDFVFMENPTRDPLPSSLVFRTPAGEPNFLETGVVEVRLDDQLGGLWKGKGRGFSRDGNSIRITGREASLDDLILPPGFKGRITIRFKSTTSTPRTTFYVDAVHVVHGDPYAYQGQARSRDLGGVSWEVHTELNYQRGTTVQRK